MNGFPRNLIYIPIPIGTKRKIPHWLSWTRLKRFNRWEVVVGYKEVVITGRDHHNFPIKMEKINMPIWELMQ